jgi:pilus assembly protein Flp/PilA
MLQLIKRFRHDMSGATAIEYGLIAALIAVAALSMLAQTGSKLNGKFTAVANGLN